MSIRDERKQQNRQAIIDTALLFSASGRSFSNISLREVTRTVGLVPAAFYRHFQNMDALGLEIIDQVSLHFKNMLYHFGQTYTYLPDAKIEDCLDLLFQTIDKNPQQWIFLVTERWGGSSLLRDAISRELNFIIQDLVINLEKIQHNQNIISKKELSILAQMLMDLAFNWAMTWINYQHQFTGDPLKQQQQLFKEQAMIQAQLLFRGISFNQT